MSAINRLNTIRLIDKRYAIHCHKSIATYRVLASVKFQYDHPKIMRRWKSSSHRPANVAITPVFKTALNYGNKIAIKDEFGEYSYDQMHNGAAKIAAEISKICGGFSYQWKIFESFFLIVCFYR